MSDSFTTESKIQAKRMAYEAVEKLKPEPTSVVGYQSRGHVVILANSDELGLFIELPSNLTSETVRYEGESASADITIDGALGQFTVTLDNQSLKADLILDLLANSVLTMELKPPGYFVADVANTSKKESNQYNIEAQNLKAKMAELVGTFEKPKYFDYNESICAHGRSGKSGCTRCLDACPAEAISSLIDKIEVDPLRCQGGGVCAMVCPSSAITYAYPKPKDLLTHVRTLILTYLKEGGSSPDVFFVTEGEREEPEQILPASLIIEVEEVASVGPEIWLSALAWGAKSVRLFDLNNMPKSARTALDQQVAMVQTMLTGANYPASSLLVITDLSDLIASSSMPTFDLATHAPITGKREALYMALDHLVAKSNKVESIVELSEGSIFGQVEVNKESCTLCMACVSACPANALQDGSENPMLGFIETNCLQCGVCVNTCPESAMTMTPRIVLDREQRRKPRVLNEEEPFCCISCGKPFATKSGISTILSKLAGHPMFAEERAKNRLKMCDDCRVVDMMEDPLTDF